ncbi:MAG: alpha/beta hydrolase [Deferribacterota bacterium]|nr:alpha/beta hydrolase [Deferribacterota bacterium]
MNAKYRDGYFEGCKKTKLFYRNWIVNESEADVVFLHGFGDHSARYGHFAAFLSDNNISFYTYDLRGHGKSEGIRWDIEYFDYFSRDLEIFIKNFLEGKKNIFFIGYSMGTLIVLKYLLKSQFKPKGVILISPAFGTYLFNIKIPSIFIDFVSLLSSPILKTLEGIARLPLLGTKVYDNYLTHNEKEIEAIRQDSLVNRGSIKFRMAIELSKNIVEVRRRVKKLDFPILILFGRDDRIIPTLEIKKFYNRLENPDKELVEFPDLYHDLLHEVRYERVYNNILDWISNKLNEN